MGLETGTYIEDLDPVNPTGIDPKSQGDDHLRLIKSTIQASFPNTTGPWNTTDPIAAGPAVSDGQLMQLGQMPKTAMAWVGTAGNVLAGTGNFSVVRTGTGVYEVTFDDSASSLYRQCCQATAYSGISINSMARLDGLNVITFLTSNGGILTDALFNFRRELF